MNKLLKIIIFCFIAFYSNYLAAQDFNKNKSFSLNLGYSQLNIDKIIYASNSSGLNYDGFNGGLSLIASAKHHFTNSFSLNLNVGNVMGFYYGENDILYTDETGSELGTLTYDGYYRVSIYPISLCFQYALIFNKFQLSFSAGPEYYFSFITHKMDFGNNSISLGIENKKLGTNENSKFIQNIGVLISIRPEYYIGNRLLLISALGYRFSDLIKTDNDVLDFSGLFINFGIEYLLKK